MTKWLFFFVVTVSASNNIGSRNVDSDIKESVCFIYHRFADSRYPSTNVSIEDFEAHLKFLVEKDFQVLTFSQAVSYVKSSQPAKKTAVITIDDGYKSFYKHGLPLLKKYNMPATLFINTETVGAGDYMTWDELKEAMNNGVEIGNHTHSHNYFLNLPAASRYETFRREIELSQSIIKRNLNIDPKIFSYPYGEFDAKMKEIAKQAGFIAAAAQNSGVLSESSDFFQCPRFPMSESYSAIKKFAEKTSMHSLQILKQTPGNYSPGDQNAPSLTLTLASADLSLKQLQCFVQGGECDVQILETSNESATLSLRALKPLGNRRRTLYTLTIPDKQGRWHWFSYLWINPAIVGAGE